MGWVELLPAVNAALNLTSTALLVAGFVAVRRRRIERHRRFMLAAVASSAVFLVSYLTRVALTGTHRFPDLGAVRTVYLALLASHTLLAALVLPLVLRSVYLGLRREDVRHRRIARVTWPVWLYVSITGVLIYLMLYQVAPRLVASG